MIGKLERGELPEFRTPPQQTFFGLLREHLQEGLFADPAYGGNRDKLGWKFLDAWSTASGDPRCTGALG